MPVVMMVDNPNGTAELYDKVRAELGQDQAAGGSFTSPGRLPTAAFA